MKKTVKVQNRDGIHCRPSSIILLAAKEFPDCKFRVLTRKGESDLTSILSLISLGLECDDEVTVEVSGRDKEAACEKIASLFAFEFDFPRE